ncbi:MAG: Gfo/Idh/MocA family oxidoreductase [Chloroflexi bacterium]|nr:Gfo/Idh/MocA family oxidoreductase [Chloroflexota bacterium]
MVEYKVGLVGCGHISGAHLRAWARTEGGRVQGVFDLNRELAEKRAREFKIATIYEELEQLIAECDVVDVCTPPQSHGRIARQVIAAGQRLVIEKPLVTDMADWEEMARLLAGSPDKITVIHNLKFSHSVQQARRWVHEGRIGRIIRVQREFLTSPEADRMLAGNSHWSHQLPGGRWFETLPHELYLTHYFAGPLELAGVSTAHTDQAPAGAPADEVIITLKNGQCLATIHFSANCRQNRRVFTVQGTEGTITVDILGDFATLTTSQDRRWKRSIGGVTLLASGATMLRWLPDRSRYFWRQLQGETPHTRIIRAFDEYLQGQGPVPTPLDEVDYVVRNCERIGREIDRQVAGGRVIG